MGSKSIKSVAADILHNEWRQLTTMNPSDRPWQMPFAAAFAVGLPLLIGCWFGHMDYGLISSTGGLAFMYVPPTPMYHRMVTMMTCAFAISACFALGVASQYIPEMMIPLLTFIVATVTMIVRFYNLGPPGSVIFVMAAAIGAYTPVPFLQFPLAVGLVFLGALLACLIVFFYSLYILRKRPRQPPPPPPEPTFDYVVFDSLIIGAFVGGSLLIAQAINLERPYWVPISCLAVIQGASLRAVWNRQLHRVVGTSIGLILSWGILALPLNPWTLSLTMMVIVFVVENAIVRNYASAAVFFTPMAILLAEAVHFGRVSPALLIEARLFDTLLGCSVALVGAACIHNPTFRGVVGTQMRRLIPARPPTNGQ